MLNADELKYLRESLQDGQPVPDRFFDRLYPGTARLVSSLYWTPVVVARRAAQWLSAGGSSRVLDVGAGVGKFCLVGALTVPQTLFVGIEHRAHLVAAARDAIQKLSASNAEIQNGTLETAPWHEFNAFYFYNPFDENRFSWGYLDTTVELSSERFLRDLGLTVHRLEVARKDTRVVTYYGLGGEMPPQYELAYEEVRNTEYLRFWIKIR